MRNLYNHYISDDSIFSRIKESDVHWEDKEKDERKKTNFFQFLNHGKSEKNAGISGILKRFNLDDIDAGDILLFLIMIFILMEGDNWELGIILGLVLFLSLGSDDPM